MRHVLLEVKNPRPDKFREELRVSPCTFDMLVAAIENDPIFQNASNTAQMAVEEQLAITLYRFGHDGNAAGLQGVANWAAVGKGTVLLVTRRLRRRRRRKGGSTSIHAKLGVMDGVLLTGHLYLLPNAPVGLERVILIERLSTP
ncbi:hypothetical protein M378DRAFT_18370 [Amanita muscaria Koide BX008]|uniref:Uncharacterized protein n=1 Tax=Amanita muscaria (strain Koide BX008) TaxID=946122 RepID=A0A0C2RXD0_AMAMK|nr:hypothetical protein M378DRAFT_18370 [Amanita muscaria Koide BX008]